MEPRVACLAALCTVARAILFPPDAGQVSAPAPHVAAAFVSNISPELLLLQPPPSPLRPSLRGLFAGLERGPVRRGLEEAYAQESLRLAHRAGQTLAADGPAASSSAMSMQTFEMAAVCFDALLACVGGKGADWRRGGWSDGRPRLLTDAELHALMSAQISRLCQVVNGATGGCHSPSRDEALMFLMRARWDLPRATQSVLHPASGADGSDSGPVGEDAAVTEATAEMEIVPTVEKEEPPLCGICTNQQCGICFDEPEPPNQLRALRCGHQFCSDCWGGMLRVAVERGPACIFDTCPQPGCDVAISGDVWASTLAPESAVRWRALALRSFVEGNTLLAYCPNASCGRAAALTQPSAPPEVLGCGCGASYCVLCSGPPHWPLSCSRKRKWEELMGQSPDAAAILQLTRPCPACGVRTQRSQGCMHISCTQCSAEWCWACGQTGKAGEVHHAFQCTRKPDPSWVYVSEEQKVVDGSLHRCLDEWLYRTEQCELVSSGGGGLSTAQVAKELIAQQRASESGGGGSGAARSGAVGLTPTSLRPTLLRALTTLRWMQVYLYYTVDGSMESKARAATRCLAQCADELYAACGYGSAPSGGSPDWSFLASETAAARRSSLVTCLLYLGAHLRAGPP
jgi:hypothetical protein